jgi:hypothetical protein
MITQREDLDVTVCPVITVLVSGVQQGSESEKVERNRRRETVGDSNRGSCSCPCQVLLPSPLSASGHVYSPIEHLLGVHLPGVQELLFLGIA